jgi:hypothetical protein
LALGLVRENLSEDRIYSNLIGEKLHTKFCKYILGVHKKITNFAVLSELGRFPLYYDIIKSIFHYWNRLEYLEKFPLLYLQNLVCNFSPMRFE